jgi:exopolysaccharide biosynthesis polyprenyl glycosylphosphotransferase
MASDAALHGASPDDAAVRAGLIRWAVSSRGEWSHSRWLKSYLLVTGACDAVCALAAGLLALEARFAGWPNRPREYLVFTALMPLLWVLSLAVARGYDARFVGVGPDEFRNVLNVGATLTAAIAILSFLTKSDIARGYVVIAIPCATAFDLFVRYGLRKNLHRRRRAGACMRRVIAVGPAARVAELIGEMRREKYHGLSIVGACLTESTMLTDIAGIPVWGGIGSVSAAIAELDADTVAVAAYRDLTKKRLRELAWELEVTGTELYVAPALLDVAGPRTTIRPVAGLPLLYVDHPEFSGIRWSIKGLFDKLAATAALVISAPLLGVIALAIALRDGRPVLFRQLRVGKDGRIFTRYKFRTMVLDAEQRNTELPDANERAGQLVKLRHDPRITRTGSWLRRYSLNGLPQLFNVLKGDMSFVGPRPPSQDEVERYSDYARRRLVVKPGITGLWQVNRRSGLSWEEAVRLDLRYVENWSLGLDVQVLWKSCSAIFKALAPTRKKS